MATDADQGEAIGFLSRPQAYGLALDVTVERIDTHGAVVFLVGDRVFKLKRAVKFPFMDFSTVARRRAMCCAEVEINRRTAPDLYLGVAALQRQGAGLRLGPVCEPSDLPADAVDWLVAMRRFNADRLLDAVAVRGELSVDLAERLADAVAAFHRDAERMPDRGGALALAEAVALDVGQMTARGDLLDRDIGTELAALMPRAAAAMAAAADRRRVVGAVRRCHGDLHLGNIFLDGDRPIPFDAIEFNERLSCIDTLYDLAFLLMDMDFRGLRAQANRLLNRYLWLCDGPDRDNLAALALLPIYLARRGAIRAHVGAAGLAHLAGMAAERERERARAYQRYALGALRVQAPRLVAIGGLSGTGKTSLALALAPRIGAIPGAVVLRSDVLRKRLAGVALDRPMPAGSYTPESSAAIYRELVAQAAIALRTGHSVIADAVFARSEERAAIAQAARQAGVRLDGLWLQAPADALKARVAARRGDASDATPLVVERQLAYAVQDMEWPVLSTAGPLPAVAEAARPLLGL
jgi:aminoglycoside phosphotransferase family enzyme/predicted kinase